MGKYKLIFGKSILKKLKKIEKREDVKELISKMLNKIEEKGPKAGEILDVRLNLFLWIFYLLRWR